MSSSSGGAVSYSSLKTAEERAAYIKQQAAERLAARHAALGLKAPSNLGETSAQRAEREKAERAAKIRQAEEEDARREAERQAKLSEETGAPAPASVPKESAKKPPPPPIRKGAKADDTGKKAEGEAKRVAEERRLEREREAE